MSSSGVVVVSLPSLRAFQSIGKVPRFDDENATVPEPSMSDPVQVLVASLVTGMVTSGSRTARAAASRPGQPTYRGDPAEQRAQAGEAALPTSPARWSSR
ncbi:hypothetical protein GCM10009651_07200 [Microbacterium natoriense]